MRLPTLALALVLSAGCEQDITNPTPVEAQNPSGATNTNTNTININVTIDRSDTGPVTPPPQTPGGDGGSSDTATLPAYGEGVTLAFGRANPSLVANSCQLTAGDAAWRYLDQLIGQLRGYASDPRWGYLCKDAGCTQVARDVVAYKARSGDLGIWIVDVLGNHCPGPGDSAPEARWGVLPFETIRRWTGTRP